jgi:hypothetical protein
MIHTRLNGGKGFHVADHLGLTSQSWASLGIFPRVFCPGKNWKNTIIRKENCPEAAKST